MPDETQFPEPEPAWIGVEDLPLQFANSFAGIVGPNAVFVNIGSAVPPVIESEEDLFNTRFVPVRPIARLAMTPSNLDDLIETLENTRKIYRDLKREEDNL